MRAPDQLVRLHLLVLTWLSAALTVHGALFVTSPYQGLACHGGEPCTVEWLDDGRQPLLNAIGPSSFALYYRDRTLAQQLQSALDVSSTRQFTFTPDPRAGPNADTYYIQITSNTLMDPNDTQAPYQSFSGRFTIDRMTGSAGAPVLSDTSSIPIPSSASVLNGTPTSTNGVISTTTLPVPTTFVTSTTTTSSSTSTLPLTETTPASGAAGASGTAASAGGAAGASDVESAGSSLHANRASLVTYAVTTLLAAAVIFLIDVR